MVAWGVEEPPAAGLIWTDVSPEQQVFGRSEACDGSDLPLPRSADGGRGGGLSKPPTRTLVQPQSWLARAPAPSRVPIGGWGACGPTTPTSRTRGEGPSHR